MLGKLFVPVHIMTWVNSYAAVISSCFWDTLVVGVIMEEVGSISVLSLFVVVLVVPSLSWQITTSLH